MFTRLLSVLILGLALAISQANAQIEFPANRSSEDEIKRSVESIDNFLYSRSNIRLSETVKTRLIAAERQVALSANSRLTSDQLIDILTDVALKRLRSLTEDDIRKAKATYEKSYVVDGSYAGFTWKQIKLSPADLRRT